MNDTKRAALLFEDLHRSVTFLQDVLKQPRNDYMRAATIQSFEICFELSWKYLQAQLWESGIDTVSPRSAFREGGKVGLIDDVTSWLIFVQQRSLTVHTYQPKLAGEIFNSIVTDFLPAVQQLLEAASSTISEN